jgi:putative aldouronate transport system substrate-binding protein
VTPPLAGAATNRRKFLGLTGLSAAAVAGGGLLSACGEGGGSKGAADDTSKVSGVLPAQGKLPDGIPQPDITSTRPIPDGYNKYPSNLVDLIADKPGSSGKEITAMTPAWGPAPPGLGQNAYLAAINDELGVPVNFSIQDGLTYADKLNAMLGARDVPELLCVPQWEVEKLPRFADAVKVLFEDLTDHLAGDKVNAYPMLASFPTGAWQNALWNQRLMAVPNPTDGPFPWALFYRKDLLDAKGLTYRRAAQHRQAGDRHQGRRVGVQRHLRDDPDVSQVAGLGDRVAAQGRRHAGAQVRDARVQGGPRGHGPDLQGGPGPPRPRGQQGR